MTICKPFDIAVVLFPFIDHARGKPRPALVLSKQRFNEAHGATVMAMITTAAYTRWTSDVAISDVAKAGAFCRQVQVVYAREPHHRAANRPALARGCDARESRTKGLLGVSVCLTRTIVSKQDETNQNRRLAFTRTGMRGAGNSQRTSASALKMRANAGIETGLPLGAVHQGD